MPEKLKKKFIEEYGKEKGERVFYAWEKKRHSLKTKHGGKK